jgi:catechol 2,3-dioxygenase
MIERVSHVALHAPDPANAARFAAEKMGLSLVHVSEDGAHYLKAHGPDPYSVVYTPGDVGLDHVSFLVKDLAAAAARLEGFGVAVEHVEGIEWEHPAAIRFRSPAGFIYELTTGVHTDLPVAHIVDAPEQELAPIAPDHVGLTVPDFEAEVEFAQKVLGLLPSNKILSPDGLHIMSFLRAPGRYLYHQLVIFRSAEAGVQHYQMSMKSLDSFYEAYEALKQNGVDVEWGPLRHGPGHNVAIYFKDGAGYWIEYSVEEELILDDEHYVPRTWTVSDPHVVDEWQSGPPPAGMMGPPPQPPDTPEQARLREEVAKHAEHMLNLRLYVGHCKINMASPPPPIDVIHAHVQWILELEASGKLFAAGPFVDDGGNFIGDGLYIVRAANRAEAKAIIDEDPIQAGGFRISTVYGWEVHQGSFSDKQYALS